MQPEASWVMKGMKYVGIDVGKAKCRAAIMDPKGFIVKEFTFSNNLKGIEDLTSILAMEDRVVMESTGSVLINLYNILEERHMRVVLANLLKTKAIASAKMKSDKVDARILAHLLRSDLVAESYVPPKELRKVRALKGHRSSIVKMRTMIKNRVHALIDTYGFKHEGSDLFGKEGWNGSRRWSLTLWIG